MCGIAGVFGVSDPGVVATMGEALAHRGPDDSGLFLDGKSGIGLASRRLSVLDPSPAGRQPVSAARGRYRAVHNGEIVNFRELRDELAELGHPFSSDCDAEVVAAAWAQWGPGCLSRLRGMFAFAVADLAPPNGPPRMFLARDRLGIKPLVFREHGGRLWFASELGSLVASRAFQPEIDAEALVDYLAYGSVRQPRTILRGVRCLAPGHYLEVRRSGSRLVRYWDLHLATERLRREVSRIPELEAVDRVRCALEDAVRGHLVADVPVGAFLSGGLDSTTVVALMRRASPAVVRTFCVGFDAEHPTDERSPARDAARELETLHEDHAVTAAEIGRLFPEIVAALDQPSIDGTNTWLVARAASRSVKVAMTGLGGDELLAGYPHFRRLSRAARWFPQGAPALVPLLEAVVARLPETTRPLYEALLLASPPERRHALYRRLLDDRALARNVAVRWHGTAERRRPPGAAIHPDADEVQHATYAEILGYLPSTLLRDTDAMSMTHGLEVRPPLLDHPLVELLYALPGRFKLRGRTDKWILRQAVTGLVPPAVLRRAKTGFELPYLCWMTTSLRQRLLELLECGNAHALFRPRYLEATRSALRRGRPPAALWAWGVLLEWLESQNLSL